MTEKASLEAKQRAHGGDLEEASIKLKERTRELEALKGLVEVRDDSTQTTPAPLTAPLP